MCIFILFIPFRTTVFFRSNCTSDVPFCSTFAVLRLKLTIFWKSSTTVKFESCSNFIRIQERISGSLLDVRPLTRFVQFNLSENSSSSLHFTHLRLSLPAYMTRSLSSPIVKYRHNQRVSKSEFFPPKMFDNMATVSLNDTFSGAFNKMKFKYFPYSACHNFCNGRQSIFIRQSLTLFSENGPILSKVR